MRADVTEELTRRSTSTASPLTQTTPPTVGGMQIVSEWLLAAAVSVEALSSRQSSFAEDDAAAKTRVALCDALVLADASSRSTFPSWPGTTRKKGSTRSSVSELRPTSTGGSASMKTAGDLLTVERLARTAAAPTSAEDKPWVYMHAAAAVVPTKSTDSCPP